MRDGLSRHAWRSGVLLLAGALLAELGLCGTARAQDTDQCIASAEQSLTLRKEGRLIEARKALLTCSASSCPDEVRAECGRRIDRINAIMPGVVFEAKDGAGKDLSAVEVTMDGALLVDHLDGTAVTVDPGTHTFTFRAKGLPPVTKTLVVAEGETARRERLIIGQPAPRPAPHPVTVAPPPASPPSTPEGHPATLRTAGAVVGVTGILAVGAGAIAGAVANSTWADAKRECTAASTCGAGSAAQRDASTAGTAADLSTVLIISGSIAAVTGLLLFLVAPHGHTEGHAGGIHLGWGVSASGAPLLGGTF